MKNIKRVSKKFRAIKNPNLYYWVEPMGCFDNNTYYVVVCAVEGFPATEGFDEILKYKKAAIEIAKMLAETN